VSEEKDVLICRCNEVTLEEVEQAISDGFVTINEIKRRTRAGMGLCQGRTCGKLVARLIAQKTGKKLSEIEPSNRRMPVRPVKMDLFEGA
jgi:NAD(P)H-nitrite reductase large subunit